LLIAIHKRESRDTHNTSSNTWDWISLIKEVNLVKPELLSRGLRAHKDLTQAAEKAQGIGLNIVKVVETLQLLEILPSFLQNLGLIDLIGLTISHLHS